MKQRPILIAALSMLLSLACLSDQAAFAHTKVNKSVPEDGATVEAELAKIELHFAGKMRLTVVNVSNVESGETITPTAPLPKKLVSTADIDFPPLDTGNYEVSWVGVGSDGHVMKGQFKFSVAEQMDHDKMDHGTMGRGEMNAVEVKPGTEALGVGVLNSVDSEKGMVNLTHEPMPQLGWPTMTMDLPVTNHVDLGKVKAGDKIEFKLKLGRDKQYRLVEMTPAK